MGPLNLKISRAEFFEKHYEKLPYLDPAGACVDKITWRHVDDILFGWEPDDPQISLHLDGPIPREKYIEDYHDVSVMRPRLVKDALYDYLRNGATLILNKAHRKSIPINDLCLEVSQFIGEKTNANAYIAFGGNGSFGRHWDTHDVFAIQLIGQKRWKIYLPTFELPLSIHSSKEHKPECPSQPFMEKTLHEGDVLYLPRGWWHEALPIEGQESLHIAIGCFPAKLIDYFQWICGKYLPLHLEARRSLNRTGDLAAAIEEAAAIFTRLATSPALRNEYLSAQRKADRVNSRFKLSALTKQNITGPIQYARVASSFPLSPDESDISINGFKLSVDRESRSFLSNLQERFGGSRKSNSTNFSEREQSLLEKLALLDVVDLHP